MSSNGASQAQASQSPIEFDTVREGSATIRAPKGEIFYNNVQIVNRDLSIAAITVFERMRRQEICQKREAKRVSAAEAEPAAVPGLRILEALAATGLRSIRYFNEIPNIDSILVNDFDPAAVASIRSNIEYNNISTEKLIPNRGDACEVMYRHRDRREQFDVVDLDPYGSANIFMDTAVQAVQDGGLICITCTDLAVLAGSKPLACFAKYGIMPHRAKYCHEMALRIMLANAQHAAGRHGRYIVPMLSCSIDFYIRIFVRIYSNKKEAWNSSLRLSNVLQCSGCDSFFLQPLARKVSRDNGNNVKLTQGHAASVGSHCSDCGSVLKVAGPFWSAPIHNAEFVASTLEVVEQQHNDVSEKSSSSKKLIGLLQAVKEELIDVPLYYDLSVLCNRLRCTTPKAEAFRSALVNAGFRVSQSHCTPTVFKTDAPSSVVWDIMRCWVKLHPVKAHKDGSVPANILGKAPQLEADFSVVASQRRAMRVPKYVQNPTDYWGPKARAKPRGKRTAPPRPAAREDDAVPEPEPKKACV